MAVKGGSGGSFVRKSATPSPSLQSVGVKPGPHGTYLVSTGFSDLDRITGGGIPVGGIMMIIEDLESPHHMLLIRYFMAQALVHGQPLLYGSPLASPQAFLGTLPGIAKSKEKGTGEVTVDKTSQREGLRIAWQYRKYMSEQQALEDRRQQQQELNSQSQKLSNLGIKQDYCSHFDLKRPMERTMLSGSKVDCVSLQAGEPLHLLRERCTSFFSRLSRQSGIGQIGRVALQSLCAPNSMCFDKDWKMLAFLQCLKGLVRASNAVALVTFPAALLNPSSFLRWQHMADILISVEAIPDENKEMAALLTDYQDMVGFLHILKLPSINTQVPTISEAAMYAIKLLRRKTLALECLHEAPVDAGDELNRGSVSSALCSGPANASSPLDF